MLFAVKRIFINRNYSVMAVVYGKWCFCLRPFKIATLCNCVCAFSDIIMIFNKNVYEFYDRLLNNMILHFVFSFIVRSIQSGYFSAHSWARKKQRKQFIGCIFGNVFWKIRNSLKFKRMRNEEKKWNVNHRTKIIEIWTIEEWIHAVELLLNLLLNHGHQSHMF